MSAGMLARPSRMRTLADLLNRLGDIPLDRVRMTPYPGTATEKDLLQVLDHEDRICELIDGVLVEKPVGYYESRLAVILIHLLESFLEKHDLGIILGPDGTIRIAKGLVRIPDIAFFSWRHFPQRALPLEPIPFLVPDLAVEVLSESNTLKEMVRKYRELFKAGTQLVWEADPDARTVTVFTSPSRFTVLKEGDTLDGGKVLPGFKLPIRRWFARAGLRK